MSAPDDSAIIAALVWDRPTLVRSSAPGAKAFVEALGPPPYREKIEAEDSALSIAAIGIRLEHQGQPQEALAQYGRLFEAGGWASVLGGFLVAWSAASGDPNVLDGVAEATRALRFQDDTLRARLLVKLATFAIDKQRGELFVALLGEAAEATPSGSSIRRAIQISRANLLGVPLEDADFDIPAENDPLVDYPWIDHLALSAARAEIQGLLKSRASSPWSWSIHGGRTPLDQVLAAERQATWAGALWLRDPIRQQLAAQILNDIGRDAYRTFYGLAMWLLAGGADVAQIIDFAEPKFGDDTADRLVAFLEAQEVIPRVRDVALPKTAIALWDLLSSEALDRLLGRLRPLTGPIAIDQEVRQLWGRAALVAPQVWQEQIETLEPPQQAAVMESLPAAVIPALPRSLAEQLVASADDAGADLSPAALGTALIIRRLLGREVSISNLEGAAYVAAEVALRQPEALPVGYYEWAEHALRETLRKEVEAALHGSAGFGGRSTAQNLAIVAQARGDVDERTTEELVSEVFNEQLPGDIRFDAFMALARLAGADLVATETLDRLKEVPQHESFSFFMPISGDLLRAACLAVRAKRLDADEEIAVLTLSRNPDTRVRQIICVAAGRFLVEHASAPVEAALLAGLFDPDESVLTSALSALESASLTELSDDAVMQRLPRLYEDYGRGVRAATVRAARSRLGAKDDPRLRQIIQSGGHDRSWLVRNAASESDASS